MTNKEDTPDQWKVRLDRRDALTCMAWAGTGLLWAMNGGAPLTAGFVQRAEAATGPARPFTFLQISDSHVGFDKPANPDALGTLREAIAMVKALPQKPAFMIHTGDITHLSKDEEFDQPTRSSSRPGFAVHYVPGEHDVIDEERGAPTSTRYGRGAKGAGWYSFDHEGVHFIGLVNVVDLKAGGLGNLGAEQLDWLGKDVASLSTSTPIVVFAHIPLVDRLSGLGLGHRGRSDGAVAI